MKLASNGGPQAVSRPIGAFTSIGQEEAQAASDVVLSGSLSGFFGSPRPGYFGGNEVQKLEAAWCERFGVEHAITVNSATSGLFVAMGAIGLSPGMRLLFHLTQCLQLLQSLFTLAVFPVSLTLKKRPFAST